MAADSNKEQESLFVVHARRQLQIYLFSSGRDCVY